MRLHRWTLVLLATASACNDDPGDGGAFNDATSTATPTTTDASADETTPASGTSGSSGSGGSTSTAAIRHAPR
jgi:hypothetical protein